MNGARLAALAFVTLAAAARASATEVCAVPAFVLPSPVGGWSPPLDRLVSFHASDVSLRDALDRLAVTAHVRLSYSSDAVPLDQRVCLARDSTALGDLFAMLLGGTGVRPVVAASDHIVLSPVGVTAGLIDTKPVVLDRVVVTGSAAGGAQRALPIALDIVDGRRLAQQSQGELSAALSSSVPGLWLWQQSPASLLARYGSIRGVSSFGLSYPKVFIDGIEVANPLLITRLTPDAIERVEVIRGPQGAALYGADAISGVTNIVTRQSGAAVDGSRTRLRSEVGLSASDFTTGPALVQSQGLTINAGSNTRSLGLHVLLGTEGAFLPGAYARYFTGAGNVRSVGEHTLFTGTLRLFGERAGSTISPILADSLGAPAVGVSPQSVFEYTAGGTLRILPGDRWTHTLVAGIDGYSLDGVEDDRAPIPAAADSALRAARGSAARGTLRWSSMVHMDLGAHAAGDLTFIGEQTVLRQDALVNRTTGPGSSVGGEAMRQWRSTSGATALANVGIEDRMFFSGGLRFERATGVDGVLVPMIGAGWVVGRGYVTLKVRGAYGSGVRWPQTTPRQTMWEGLRPGPALDPERQSGLEGGFDLLVGRTFTLTATRFDQTASGLIQRVTTRPDTATSSGGHHVGYTLQNVGAIQNRGWELQASIARGGLSLMGSLSSVDSRVQRLALGYSGDLQLGDRMLEVPARTLSLTAAWTATRWSGTLTAYRAEDWINYDRLALARAVTTDTESMHFVGQELRSYWKRYPGVTHLRASASWFLSPGFALTLLGDNLLDRQTGEPDNITVLPGRTFSLGFRADF